MKNQTADNIVKSYKSQRKNYSEKNCIAIPAQPTGICMKIKQIRCRNKE
jgi:hypothetical protein